MAEAGWGVVHGDCLDVMRTLDDASVDAVVTDPPYGLTFMGKGWDHGVPGELYWREALRVAKPGAHLLAFGGTRTHHRLMVAIEDAGWEIRDVVMWVYGSGFPKSLDVSKAIDKAAGAEMIRIAGPKSGGMAALNKGNAAHGYRDAAYYDDGNMMLSDEPATESAAQWQGWGTALKPAWEPIIVARKPLIWTVAENVLRYGVGALNVDGCRVAHDEQCRMMAPSQANIDNHSDKHRQAGRREAVLELKPSGRWPANLIHDGSDEVVGLFPDSKSTGGRTVKRSGGGNVGSGKSSEASWTNDDPGFGDSGSAARFFYCAKASKADRDSGGVKNIHATVKPTTLMRYLCKLVTPHGGLVLDPFMGSGSTGKGAILEGFRFIGIDQDPEYCEIARRRLAHVAENVAVQGDLGL